MALFYSKNNLKRAWKWLKSNPDWRIKDEYHMRTAYGQFSAINDSFIEAVGSELRSGVYDPSVACKAFIPKSSGGLRPYSLLSVKDQLVYQAMVNIIAEKHSKKYGMRYLKGVYGNMYAGDKSDWFYTKWQAGYSAFNQAARRAHASGHVYLASFDLVACFDSIDHRVLGHYLRQIGVGPDLVALLLRCLTRWTSTDHDERIFQGHGIPQGPMASGLLAEVVLTAFDNEKIQNGVTCLRYVDDIWFMAKDENSLRFELVRMDRVCKKVGLFPQSSKIKIGRVKDIESELKALSGVGGTTAKNLSVADLERSFFSITARGAVKDITKFRYASSVIQPKQKVIDRLWGVYFKHPETYPQLCGALLRRGKLSKASRKFLLMEIRKRNPYNAIHAALIGVLSHVSLSDVEVAEFTKLVKDKFYAKGAVLRGGDVMLSIAVIRFLSKYHKLSQTQIKYMLKSPHWYARARMLESVDDITELSASLMLTDSFWDVQLAAAQRMVNLSYPPPRGGVRKMPSAYFKAFGVRSRKAGDPTPIEERLRSMFRLRISVDWKKILGSHYKQAEKVMVQCAVSRETNVGAWICELDVFNELLVRGLFEAKPALGSAAANFGHMLVPGAPKYATFQKKYAFLASICKSVHDRRKTTTTAHAYTQSARQITGKTRPFKHHEIDTYVRMEAALIRFLAKYYSRGW